MQLECGTWRVRSWRDSDLAALVVNANNRNVWLQLRDRFPHPYTRQAGKAWLRHATTSSPEISFAIDVDGDAVGGIGIVLQGDVDRASAEIGYWLGEPFWGRGIATAALRTVTPWVFERFPGVHRLFAVPFARNAASRRILDNCGYILEGMLWTSAIKDGEVLDQALYARYRAGVPDRRTE